MVEVPSGFNGLIPKFVFEQPGNLVNKEKILQEKVPQVSNEEATPERKEKAS